MSDSTTPAAQSQPEPLADNITVHEGRVDRITYNFERQNEHGVEVWILPPGRNQDNPDVFLGSPAQRDKLSRMNVQKFDQVRYWIEDGVRVIDCEFLSV
ncbi:hypothetical protein MMC28_004614 [Mycoblastus sanguinarius]|nr:hypothetical protein [Mycoblastus sanguinarius]